MATTVLDNEAVQALMDPAHRKHRRALAFVQVAAGAQPASRGNRGARGADGGPGGSGVGPHRATPASAINRLRIADHLLDRVVANGAAQLRAALGRLGR